MSTNKIDLIKAEIERLKESGCASPIVICDTLLAFIDSLQEEHVSDGLEEAANNALKSISDKYDIISVGSCLEMFRIGAHWQKQQMMKDAVDGRFSYNPNFKENEFICLEKSDTPEHYLGELVKVIIIKQEEE